jgi:hypothetical protein
MFTLKTEAQQILVGVSCQKMRYLAELSMLVTKYDIF